MDIQPTASAISTLEAEYLVLMQQQHWYVHRELLKPTMEINEVTIAYLRDLHNTAADTIDEHRHVDLDGA